MYKIYIAYTVSIILHLLIILFAVITKDKNIIEKDNANMNIDISLSFHDIDLDNIIEAEGKEIIEEIIDNLEKAEDKIKDKIIEKKLPNIKNQEKLIKNNIEKDIVKKGASKKNNNKEKKIIKKEDIKKEKIIKQDAGSKKQQSLLENKEKIGRTYLSKRQTKNIRMHLKSCYLRAVNIKKIDPNFIAEISFNVSREGYIDLSSIIIHSFGHKDSNKDIDNHIFLFHLKNILHNCRYIKNLPQKQYQKWSRMKIIFGNNDKTLINYE